MTTKITYESDFYFWIVEYLQQLGPMKMYPKALADAADLALELIAECQHESEALDELVPGALICPCCGDDRNQALGVVFHLAREVDQVRPYSEAMIHFLAECYRPPASTMFETAARVGFQLAGWPETNFFREYKKGKMLHLVSTEEGRAKLGVRVHLQYSRDHSFYDDPKPAPKKAAANSAMGTPRVVQSK